MENVAFIGLGEGAMAFTTGANGRASAIAYDRKTDDPVCAAIKRGDYSRGGFSPGLTPC